jgi:hypothetical protein
VITPLVEISILPPEGHSPACQGLLRPGFPDNATATCGPSILQERAVSHARGGAISRPPCSLPHFYQLDTEILHSLQGTVKLGLIAKDSHQN